MNPSSSYDPLYNGPRQGVRTQYNTKGQVYNNTSAHPANDGRTEESSDPAQGRAARYESEKARIISSCFSKREEDGVAAEQYITHVRVIEDGAYPTTPPPPDAAAANKKSRVILVAVRRTGRVRVHKARENPTGTFSIGKTWPLEELLCIQSYTNLVPKNEQERVEKNWAGGVGLLVTLGKPYYWQAPTSKEKDFFIGSLVKIYRKYTGGKVPELLGFAAQEKEILTGASNTSNLLSQTPASPPLTQTISPPPPIPISNGPRNQSPQSSRSQNNEQTSRARAQSRGGQTPPARDAQRPSPIEPLRSSARSEDRQSNRDHRGQSSSDNARKAQLQDPPASAKEHPQATNPYPSSSPSSSQHSIHNEKVIGKLMNGLSTQPPPPVPQLPPIDIGQIAQTKLQMSNSQSGTAASDFRSPESRFEKGPTPAVLPPDRKRHLAGTTESHLAPPQGAASESNSQFATPATSPSDLREDKIARAPSQTHDTDVATSSMSEKDYFNQAKTDLPEQITKADPPLVSPSAHEQSTIPHTNSSVSAEQPQSPPRVVEEHRPGLGPMFKKKSSKDIAGQFRRAALAASAFQPRQGGAGARLKALQDKDKASNEPDGITSVVPAPLLRGISNDTLKSSAPATPTVASSEEAPLAAPVEDPSPKVEVLRTATQDSITIPETTPPTPPARITEQPKPEMRSPSPEKARSRSPQRRKRQRQEAESSKICIALGLDPRVLDGRGGDFNDLLTEFGWTGKLLEQRRVEDFEAEIKREIGRAQATGWLGHVEQQESKVHDLANAFDKAIEECEELDGLFTLYSHELDTLSADIEYIEAQSQGLQVQTANQKLLQNELNNLLRTLTISSGDLRGLQAGSLDTETGVETVEKSLAQIYRALLTIDPDIRPNKIRQTVGASPGKGSVGIYADDEIGQMRAVREKKDHYRDATASFVHRFNQHMTAMFKGIDEVSLQESRQRLWRYNAMMLFVREFNSYEWQTLISTYEMSLKGTYQNQFRDYAMNQRRTVRKPGQEEVEALFTTQEREKSDETLASSAARKLTVKRGKTTKASGFRHQLGDKRDGKLDAYEIFGAVLKFEGNIISEEQNWVSSFFHLNSQANADFTEVINSKRPDQRKIPNLRAKLSYDPDRNMAKIVQGAIEGIYSFWLGDLQNLLDWTLGMDALQGVGVLTALEQCQAIYDETNQEYISRTLKTLHERLSGLFRKFVDEQIKAIEETKVKVKKRKGVISFMRTFPLFSASIETMIPTDMPTDMLEVRFIVNDAYNKILKAMWESLNFIAKEDPSAGGGPQTTAPSSGDPEDKEALNYHILLIENMNHYLEDVETSRSIVLEEWADKARQDFLTHLTQYTDSVIRRPLGKWLDFLESTEAMMKNAEAGDISGKPSHSKSTAKKVLSSHDSKEIKKGVETLKKRVEKHFGDIEEPSTSSKTLMIKVLEECNARYANAYERMKTIIDSVYDGNLDIDWRKEEIASMFKR